MIFRWDMFELVHVISGKHQDYLEAGEDSQVCWDFSANMGGNIPLQLLSFFAHNTRKHPKFQQQPKDMHGSVGDEAGSNQAGQTIPVHCQHSFLSQSQGIGHGRERTCSPQSHQYCWYGTEWPWCPGRWSSFCSNDRPNNSGDNKRFKRAGLPNSGDDCSLLASLANTSIENFAEIEHSIYVSRPIWKSLQNKK